VAQQIMSKAEGRIVRLAEVTPSERAENLARRTGRDTRLCQLYLDESRAITGRPRRLSARHPRQLPGADRRHRRGHHLQHRIIYPIHHSRGREPFAARSITVRGRPVIRQTPLANTQRVSILAYD